MRSFASLVLFLAACGSGTTTIDGGVDASADTSTDAPGPDAPGPDAPLVDSGKDPCDSGCTNGTECCSGLCVQKRNDPLNCGGCGSPCGGSTTMCFNGSCRAPTCQPACGPGQVCCELIGPVQQLPMCENGNTCPVGCSICP